MKLWIFFLGLDKIESLQNHENQEIYRKAYSIIERYFGTLDETENNLMPSIADNDEQFEFFVNNQSAPGGFEL